MLFAQKDHADNAPETWKVVHIKAGRRYELQTKDGVALVSHPTKKACEADKVAGFFVNLYEKEGKWFAGERIAGWKPYGS